MPELEHKRSHRVGQLIKEELGRLLVEGLKDPRVGFVTVTEVRVTQDLRQAGVYVSIFGADDVRQNSLKGLRAAAGYLRREIGHRIKLRYAPDIVFFHDDSLDRAQRVEDLLIAVARGDHEAPDPSALAPLPPAETGRIQPLAIPGAPVAKAPSPRPRARPSTRLRRTTRSSKRR